MEICAVSFVVNGCVTRAPANDGAGFERLTPSSETRKFIIANDRPFAEQVAAHNETCDQQPACRK
ncbi:hypothetical protein SAMN05216228_10025 [Rhizobium tibeticum]|uniref:Uncharacterized protein n=1 Tax=Rhizobium tibeticum TaxID=501024 RepID=A0A1H8DEL5_9HYPH|nr:hypothetical protein RTCCBAU85039_0826 [Rhizobium tibeticum]SEN04937.1 hypothetical protein SAMN05216228_10025 [Rhizobium tibeticum]